ASTSAYESSTPSNTTATASGVRATCSTNSPGNVDDTTSTAVSLQSLRTLRRSPLSSTSTSVKGASSPASNASTRFSIAVWSMPHTACGSAGATASTVSHNPSPPSSTDTLNG